MIFWLPRLGPPLKIISLALLVTLFSLSITSLFPLSKGDIYVKHLNTYYYLVLSSQISQADQLQSQFDFQDISAFVKRYHPRYLTDTISQILKKAHPTTDDLIEVALLYHTLGDTTNSRLYLDQARQKDPIRSDIDKLFSQL